MKRVQKSVSAFLTLGLFLTGCGPSFKVSEKLEKLAPNKKAGIEITGPLNIGPLATISLNFPNNGPSSAVTPTILDPKEINKCIESVCGPASMNRSGYDTDSVSRRAVPLLQKKLWTESFEPLLREALTLERESFALLARRLPTALKNGFQLSEKSKVSYRSLIGLLESQNKAAVIVQKVISKDVPTSKISIDEVKLAAELSVFKKKEAKAIRQVINRFYLPVLKLGNEIAGIQLDDLIARLKINYPGISADVALKQDAEILTSSVAVIRQEFGDFFADTISRDSIFLLNKARDGGDLSKDEATQYVQNAAALDTFAFAVEENSKKTFSQVADDPDRILEKAKANGSSDQILRMWGEDQSERDRGIVPKCEERFNRVTELDQGDVRRTKKMISEVKSAAVTASKRLFRDDALQKSLEQKINGTEFVLADRGSVRLKKFRTFAVERIEKFKQTLEQTKTPSTSMDNVLLLIVVLKSATSAQTPDDRSEVEKKCKELTLMDVTDAANPITGRISVSWFTTVSPEVGLGILSHEVGHVVSAEARRLSYQIVGQTPFDESLTCVSNRNIFVSHPRSLKAWHNTQWSEEDWADFFSSEVLMELKKAGSEFRQQSKNFACAAIVDHGDTYNHETVAPAENSVHSNGFLRLLMNAQDLQETTPQCTELLSRLNTSNRQMTCR